MGRTVTITCISTATSPAMLNNVGPLTGSYVAIGSCENWKTFGEKLQMFFLAG